MEKLEIREIFAESASAIMLSYQYTTNSYFDFHIDSGPDSWTFTLRLKTMRREIEKTSENALFESSIENPKAFKVVSRGQDLGFLQLGHETWCNRVRIWDLLVLPEHRGRGIGSQLMKVAKAQARELKARALVLETQSCNVSAINFYGKHGFQLVGFDLQQYSNDDLARQEVRLEFGFPLL